MPMVKDILVKNPVTARPEDKITRAMAKMEKNKFHQLPVVENKKIVGMLFLKDIVTENMDPNITNVKTIMRRNIPTADTNSDEIILTKQMLENGVRALPVEDVDGNLIGIISETDLIDFVETNFSINDTMTAPICINDADNIGKAKRLMKTENVSRLPVVNSNKELVGVVDTLDLIKVMKPKQRIGTAKQTAIEKIRVSEISVKTVMHDPQTVSKDAKADEIKNLLKKGEEIIIIKDKKPVGIITPKDVIELLIPKEKSIVQTINFRKSDKETKKEISSVIEKFIKKQKKFSYKINHFFLYMDEYKRGGRIKYSLRARCMTSIGLFISKSSDWNLLTCVQDVIEKLEREIMKKRGKVLNKRKARTKERFQ
ncbi:MAG: CBS domain-containing protein [Candidatus Aenigmarchaeota archaeon]|nr:CBS domain-containing protein [Candidatus Aenigmarchaeota archaeon]